MLEAHYPPPPPHHAAACLLPPHPPVSSPQRVPTEDACEAGGAPSATMPQKPVPCNNNQQPQPNPANQHQQPQQQPHHPQPQDANLSTPLPPPRQSSRRRRGAGATSTVGATTAAAPGGAADAAEDGWASPVHATPVEQLVSRTPLTGPSPFSCFATASEGSFRCPSGSRGGSGRSTGERGAGVAGGIRCVLCVRWRMSSVCVLCVLPLVYRHLANPFLTPPLSLLLPLVRTARPQPASAAPPSPPSSTPRPEAAPPPQPSSPHPPAWAAWADPSEQAAPPTCSTTTQATSCQPCTCKSAATSPCRRCSLQSSPHPRLRQPTLKVRGFTASPTTTLVPLIARALVKRETWRLEAGPASGEWRQPRAQLGRTWVRVPAQRMAPVGRPCPRG